MKRFDAMTGRLSDFDEVEPRMSFGAVDLQLICPLQSRPIAYNCNQHNQVHSMVHRQRRMESCPRTEGRWVPLVESRLVRRTTQIGAVHGSAIVNDDYAELVLTEGSVFQSEEGPVSQGLPIAGR